MEKVDKIALGILIIISLIFFWKLILNPEKVIYSQPSDTLSHYLPWKLFAVKTINDLKQFPFWDPHAFGGIPFMADLQSTLFAPFDSPLYFNFFYSFFSYRYILSIILAGIFIYFFSKEIGISKVGSFTSSIIYMFSSTMISRIYAGHLYIIDTMALAPLGFLLVERLLKGKDKHNIIFLSLFLAFQYLGSNIQIFIYSTFAILLYFELRTLFSLYARKISTKAIIKNHLNFLLATILFVTLVVFQVIPSYEWSLHTTRAGGVSYGFATDGSFPPTYLVTYLIPSFYGSPLNQTYWGTAMYWTVSGYFGIITFLLIIFALVYWKLDYVLIFTILSVFALLFSFGIFGPLFPMLYELIPIFRMFRNPASYLFIVTFSAAILSGFGINALQTNIVKNKHLKKLLVLLSVFSIAVAISVIIFILFKSYILDFGGKLGTSKYIENPNPLPYPLEYYLEKIELVYNDLLVELVKLFLVLSSTSALIFLLLRGRISKQIFVIFLVALLMLDLFSYGMKFIDVEDPKKLYSDDEVINFLKKDKETFRFHSNNTSPAMAAYTKNFRGVLGYQPTEPKVYLELLKAAGIDYHTIKDENSLKWLGILNTKYITANGKLTLEGLKEVFSSDNAYVYENTYYKPLAYVVFEYNVLEDKDILKRIETGNFASNIALINEDGNFPSLEKDSKGEAEVIYYSPNEIRIKATLSDPGLLILSDNYYPGWRVYVDSKEERIIKAYNALKAVWLDKGTHDVMFSFYPTNFSVYVIISVLTFGLLIVYLFYGQIMKLITNV